MKEYNSLNTKQLNLSDTVTLLKKQIRDEENKF